MQIRATIFGLALAAGIASRGSSQFQQGGQFADPPSRVGRLSVATGAVSLYPSGGSDWTDALVNYPVTSGDAIWVDDRGRAEVQFGPSTVRAAPRTSFIFGEVSDSVTQLRIDQGTVEIYIHDLRPDEVYEVDTPSGIISLIDIGRYRIDISADGRTSTITIRAGSAAIDGDNGSYPVRAGSSAILSDPQRRPLMQAAVSTDSWEDWANSRDQLEQAPLASRYATRDMVGYEDLDQYGDWQANSQYGAVWYPRSVPAGWAPYRYGHWESIQPWGWTWIDDAPWGFAPFHYGRWASIAGRWAWIPGDVSTRPVYAPALVAFIGGSGWSASMSAGSAPSVGWVPLGPQEPFIPAYRASPRYVQRVNTTSVRVSVNLGQSDVNNTRYVNRNVPGAITAVSRDDFTRSRPIGRTAVVNVRPDQIAQGRPSNVPLAGDERLTPPPQNQRPPNPDRNGRGNARPATPPASTAAPVPPPRWVGRTRPGNQPPDQRNVPPQNPPAANYPPPNRPGQPPVIQPPPAAAPPTTTPPPDQGRGRGRGRQSEPPVNNPPPSRPIQPPGTPPLNPPPVGTPPAPPPTTTPPPDQGRGRGRGRQSDPPVATPPPPAPDRPIQPPTTPPLNPPPVGTPPAPPSTTTPPPDQGRGRGRGRGRQSDPPVATPPPPAPDRPIQPPTTPPLNPPPVNPPPDRGRGRQPGPPAQPPTAPAQPPQQGRGAPSDNSAARQQQLSQLLARQQKETADLNARHAVILQHPPNGVPLEQINKVIDAENRALADRQKKERDAFNQPSARPGG